jgi:hypothetical protein
MSRLGRIRPLAALLLAALAGAGFLAAQRTYRGMPLPPTSELEFLEPPDGDKPAEFYFARLAYTDRYGPFVRGERPWHIDSPAAERHFLQGLRRLSNIDSRSKEVYLKATDEALFDYPWLYVVEPGHWELTDEEVDGLREYLLRGGFVIFDDFHGTYEYAMFQQGMQRIFPERPIVDLTSADEAFHTLFDIEIGEQIPGVQMLYTQQNWEQDGKIPQWKGIYDDDGRLMVIINHNMDLGDAWEHADWPEYPERYTAMAYRMAINYIVYTMTH